MEPPPRTSRITSMGGFRLKSAPCARPACASRYSFDSAAMIDGGAATPCTCAGTSTTGMCGTRRRNAVTTSCNAAAPADVTRPMPRGCSGSGRLRAVSNRPSASSCALRRRNCSNSAPCPARCMLSTMNCRSPRASYTPRRPRTSTNSPSRGEKSSSVAARRNMAQRNCPLASLIEK